LALVWVIILALAALLSINMASSTNPLLSSDRVTEELLDVPETATEVDM
jgi:hypothetical protein